MLQFRRLWILTMEYSKTIAFHNSLLVSIMLCFKCIKVSAVHFPGDSSQFVLMGGEFMVLISVMWCLRSSVKHHCFGSSHWDAVLCVAGQFSTLNYKVNWCHTCRKGYFHTRFSHHFSLSQSQADNSITDGRQQILKVCLKNVPALMHSFINISSLKAKICPTYSNKME